MVLNMLDAQYFQLVDATNDQKFLLNVLIKDIE